MNIKHDFEFHFKSVNSNIYICNPQYLQNDFYCKFCGRKVGDMFATKNLEAIDFGSGYEQEFWLNKYTPCLTIDEKLIKDLLE